MSRVRTGTNAAIDGGELADTLLTLGRVTEAVSVAEAAVAHADTSEDESAARAPPRRSLPPL